MLPGTFSVFRRLSLFLLPFFQAHRLHARALAGLFCLLVSFLMPGVSRSESGAERRQAARNLPLSFEQNQGQANKAIQYLLRYNGSEALFSADSIDFRPAGFSLSVGSIRMRMVGAGTAPQAVDRLEGRSNYLIGPDASKWIREVPHFRQISYQHLYPGISLAFYGNGDALEHDFQVEPDADPLQISLRFDGAEDVSISAGGDLKVRADGQTLTLRKPLAYQTKGNSRTPVDSGFMLRRDGTVGFRLGAYDRTLSLVIDPVFVFSSYLGGTNTDTAAAVATDAAGNIYLTGNTGSGDFPTAHPLQPYLGGCDQFAGCENAFITKLNPSGTALIYSTYLGGSRQDQGSSIVVDAAGDAIVGGVASSSDFPHAGAIQSSACQTNYDCYFLASLTPDGSSLNYSGMIGGADSVSPGVNDGRVTVDTAGNAYLTGITGDSNFQITPGTLSSSVPGYPYTTLFVLKVDPAGKLLYSTIVPGNASQDPSTANNTFRPTAISVDGSGQATVAGTAAPGLPTTPGVVGEQFPNAYINVGNPLAGFVLQLNAAASAINFASYLPGTDEVGGMAIDPQGDLYFAGATSETTLPVGNTAYQKTPAVDGFGGVFSGYIMELSSGATAALAATYLDGTEANNFESSSFTGVALDSHGNVFVGGSTGSPDFPLLDPFATILETSGTSWGLVIAELNPNLSALLFGSFLSATDQTFSGSNFAGLAIDNQDNLLVTGTVYSRNFPTTPGSFEPQLPPAASFFSTPFHSFITKINLATPAPSACLSSLLINFASTTAGTSTTQNLQVTNCGNAPLDLVSITSSDPTVVASDNCNSIAARSVCPVTLTFTPAGNGMVTGTITITDNAVLPAPVVFFSGTGQAPQIQIQPSSAEFPAQVLGINSSAAVLTISVQNVGPAPLVVQPAQTIATGDFSVLSNTCTSPVVRNAACSLQVSFTPTQLGQRTGTLSIASNDPANAVLAVPLSGTAIATYPVATLSLLLNPSYPVTRGSAGISALVQGSNFFPSSVVYVNGVAQTTMYQSSSQLNFTLSPMQLQAMGEIPVTVVNPAPGGGSSPPLPLLVYLPIALQASSLVKDPVGGLLYAAIPASATQNPSTVIPINPATGATMTPVAVSNDPQHLAVSDDGSELYVTTSAGVLQRLSLKTLAIEKTFSLPVDTEWGQTYAQEMHVVPGSPQSIVVELLADVDPAEDGAALYNDSGLVNWVPGETSLNPLTLDSFTFTNPSMIYGLPGGGAVFSVLQVSTTGLSVITPSGAGCCSQYVGSVVASDGKLVYTNSGEVWDPTTLTLLGTYLDSNGSPLFYAGRPVPDTANQHTYFLNDEEGIDVYDQAGFGLASVVPIYGADLGAATDLLRWGSNGFALRTFDPTGSDPSSNEIILLTTSKVASSSGAPVPIVSSLTPSVLYLGGPAFTLQVSGGGFTTASTVLINGNPRTTAFVDETSLTAEVLASDIASGGQLDAQVTTPAPGGGTSNYASVLLTSQSPVIAVQPSSLNLSTAQTLTLSISLSAAPGYPTPTGTVAVDSTIYSSAAVTLNGGSATIKLPPGSMLPGIENLNVSYLPDPSSVFLYRSTSAVITVAVGASSKATPTVAVTISSPNITTAQVLTLSFTVIGGSASAPPTGIVMITLAGDLLGEPGFANGSGTAAFQGALPLGSNTLSVDYIPDAASSSTYNSATASTTVVVLPAPKVTPTVTVMPSAASISTAQTLMVAVAVNGGSGNPAPSGTVTLSGGGFTSKVTALSAGSAGIPIAAGALAVGSDTLTASYTPDSVGSSTYSSSAGGATVVVAAPAKITPTVTVMPSAASITTAQTLAVTVAVTVPSGNPTPSGSVTLSGGGFASTATVLSGGSASIPIAAGALAVGSDTLTASYTPDSTSSSAYNGSAGRATVVVAAPAKITPTVTVMPSAASITTAQTLAVTVAVTVPSGNPTPSGSVTLSGGGFASTATALSGGSAGILVGAGALAVGSDTLTASYTPDSTSSSAYNGSGGAAAVVVSAPIGTTTPAVTVTPSAEIITNAQSVTINLTVTGASGQASPTGTVTLTNGIYGKQQMLLSGATSFVVAAGVLANGVDTLTAAYAGDAAYASVSGTAMVTVSPITINAATPSPVSPGGTATTSVTLSAGTSYAGTINLACMLKAFPAGAVSLPSCTLNPARVSLSSSSSGSTMLTVHTTAASTSALAGVISRFGGGATLAVVFLFAVPRKRRAMRMSTLLLLGVACWTTGCGGGSPSSGSGPSKNPANPATTAGNYVFAVTGTDSANASIVETASVTVTVE